MRRLLAGLSVSLFALGLTLVGGVPGAEAITPVTGKLVDSTGLHPAVVGAIVRLRTVVAGEPGALVDTDVTAADGTFSLDAGPTPDDEYYVQVLPGTYQGGFVGGGWVQPSAAYAVTYGPHAAIGKIRANPAFIRGVLVDAANGSPVRGVPVTARSHNDGWQLEGKDTTDRGGNFWIKGLECEDDCYLKVNGAERGYEIGYRACNGTVVADWGDACASPIGRIGKVRLDKVS